MSEHRTLILDNAQKLYDKRKGFDQPCFNWLQELQDDTKCTIILLWTPVSELHRDIVTKPQLFFNQFLGRFGGSGEILFLPDPQETLASDVHLFAKSFDVDEDAWGERKAELVKLARGPFGLRPLLSLLQKARRRASADESAKIKSKHLILPA